jgi:hypothetical protein
MGRRSPQFCGGQSRADRRDHDEQCGDGAERLKLAVMDFDPAK